MSDVVKVNVYMTDPGNLGRMNEIFDKYLISDPLDQKADSIQREADNVQTLQHSVLGPWLYWGPRS